jgi:DNA-binding response OmpR family regulator
MKTKLLIIEDEKITRRSLTDILTTEGYDVTAAEDGEEGLKLFFSERPDIVITDLRLPKLSGIDILTRVMETDPSARSYSSPHSQALIRRSNP